MAKIWVDTVELENALLKRKDYIGYPHRQSVSSVLTGLGLIVTNFFKLISLDVVGILLTILGFTHCFYMGIKPLWYNWKEQVDYKMIVKDIQALDKTEHPFSLVAIKNDFDNVAGKYLLKYDNDWDCYLFPYYRTVANSNEEHILRCLAEDLCISEESISLEYKGEDIQEKFSVRDQVNKVYHHMVYSATITDWAGDMSKAEFIVNGTRYCWMSFSEMRNDPNILKKNKDVVNLVDSFI